MTTLYLHPFDKFNILDDMSSEQCSTIECKEGVTLNRTINSTIKIKCPEWFLSVSSLYFLQKDNDMPNFMIIVIK